MRNVENKTKSKRGKLLRVAKKEIEKHFLFFSNKSEENSMLPAIFQFLAKKNTTKAEEEDNNNRAERKSKWRGLIRRVCRCPRGDWVHLLREIP